MTLDPESQNDSAKKVLGKSHYPNFMVGKLCLRGERGFAQGHIPSYHFRIYYTILS